MSWFTRKFQRCLQIQSDFARSSHSIVVFISLVANTSITNMLTAKSNKLFTRISSPYFFTNLIVSHYLIVNNGIKSY